MYLLVHSRRNTITIPKVSRRTIAEEQFSDAIAIRNDIAHRYHCVVFRLSDYYKRKSNHLAMQNMRLWMSVVRRLIPCLYCNVLYLLYKGAISSPPTFTAMPPLVSFRMGRMGGRTRLSVMFAHQIMWRMDGVLHDIKGKRAEAKANVFFMDGKKRISIVDCIQVASRIKHRKSGRKSQDSLLGPGVQPTQITTYWPEGR